MAPRLTAAQQQDYENAEVFGPELVKFGKFLLARYSIQLTTHAETDFMAQLYKFLLGGTRPAATIDPETVKEGDCLNCGQTKARHHQRGPEKDELSCPTRTEATRFLAKAAPPKAALPPEPEVETVDYTDGSSATSSGPDPLPRMSPGGAPAVPQTGIVGFPPVPDTVAANIYVVPPADPRVKTALPNATTSDFGTVGAPVPVEVQNGS